MKNKILNDQLLPGDFGYVSEGSYLWPSARHLADFNITGSKKLRSESMCLILTSLRFGTANNALALLVLTNEGLGWINTQDLFYPNRPPT